RAGRYDTSKCPVLSLILRASYLPKLPCCQAKTERVKAGVSEMAAAKNASHGTRRGGHRPSPNNGFGCRSIRAKAVSRDTSSLQCSEAPRDGQSGGGPKL